MNQDGQRNLRIALVATGLVFTFGIWPLMILWPSGWAWNPAQGEFMGMMLGIYATLGVFVIRAARDPMGNASLIWFTVWSSIVHGLIMAVQAVGDPEDFGHLFGDVPALLVVGAVLAFLMSRAAAETGRSEVA